MKTFLNIGDNVFGTKLQWFADYRRNAPVSSQPPTFATTTLPVGSAGATYEQMIAIAGSDTITVTLESGSLPTNWTFDDTVSDGTIAIGGDDHDGGTYTFTLRAENELGFDEQEFVVGVIPAVPAAVALTNAISGQTPTLSVAAVPAGATGIDFEVRLQSDSSVVASVNDDADGSWLVDTSLTNYTGHLYVARSRNAHGQSDWSDPELFTVSTAAMKVDHAWLFNELAASGDVTRAAAIGGQDLTSVNSVLSIASPNGNAAQFVAANEEYLTRAHEAALALLDRHFDIRLRVYIDSLIVGNSAQTIMGKLSSHTAFATNHGLTVYAIEVTGTQRVRVRISNGGTLTTINNGAMGVVTGQYYTFIIRHDPEANTIAIKRDDGSFVSAAHTDGVQSNTFPLRFGGTGAAGEYSNIRLDEVEIVLDDHWTDDELTHMYNAGVARQLPFPLA